MSNLPPYIIVLGCRRSNKYRTIENTLKEFFNGMPYIPYIGYDKKTTYYILPHNAVVSRIISKIYVYMVFEVGIDIMAYTTYMYTHNSFLSDYYSVTDKVKHNKMLPVTVHINKINKEKLKLFLSEDY